MVTVEINNTTKVRIDAKTVKNSALKVIEGELGGIAGVQVSIAFVGPDRIRRINTTYRKQDNVTDVLSFAEDPDVFLPAGQPRPLGELVICLDQVKKDAAVSKVSASHELAWVVIHGMLHLLGYDHEKGGKEEVVMRAKEEDYLSKIKSKTIKKRKA